MLAEIVREHRGLIMEWESRLPTEINFWKDWLRDQGGEHYHENFHARFDKNLPLNPRVEEAVVKCKFAPVQVLEVGCGPVSGMGYVVQCGKKTNIHYADPLGIIYVDAMREAGIQPMHSIHTAKAEDLARVYARDCFDIVYCANALDHSENPLLALVNMLQVLRTGGVCILEHNWREGQYANYSGLHNWDFWIEHESLLLGSDTESINLTFWLSSLADCKIWTIGNDRIEATSWPGGERCLVIARLTKRGL